MRQLRQARQLRQLRQLPSPAAPGAFPLVSGPRLTCPVGSLTARSATGRPFPGSAAPLSPANRSANRAVSPSDGPGRSRDRSPAPFPDRRPAAPTRSTAGRISPADPGSAERCPLDPGGYQLGQLGPRDVDHGTRPQPENCHQHGRDQSSTPAAVIRSARQLGPAPVDPGQHGHQAPRAAPVVTDPAGPPRPPSTPARLGRVFDPPSYPPRVCRQHRLAWASSHVSTCTHRHVPTCPRVHASARHLTRPDTT